MEGRVHNSPAGQKGWEGWEPSNQGDQRPENRSLYLLREIYDLPTQHDGQGLSRGLIQPPSFAHNLWEEKDPRGF